MATDLLFHPDSTSTTSAIHPPTSSTGGKASAVVLSALTLVSCFTGTSTQPPALRDVSVLSSWATPNRTSRAKFATESAGLPLPGATVVGLVMNRSDKDEVAWVKEHSGLTWEQLGRIFGVSRRSVHLWANGGRMNEHNAAHLREFAALVKGLDVGDPTRTRARLLEVTNGLNVIDRFRRQHVEGLRWGTAFGPEELVGAVHDEAPDRA